MTPTLSVDVLDERLRCRLEVRKSDVVSPLHEQYTLALPSSALAGLVAQVARLVHAGPHARFLSEAREVGTLLYASLVPPALRHRLRSLEGTLLVSTSLHSIPWELVHDGEEFWGLRYALGRRIVIEGGFTVLPEPRIRVRPRALVIGSDPYGDLRFVSDEVERIATVLERHVDVAYLNGPLATLEAMTIRLTDGVDLVHYCGHVVHHETMGPCLLLADARPVPCSLIQPNLVGRPIVFLNGCASAHAATDRAALDWDRLMETAAYAFLSGGAVATVGTVTSVLDQYAARFAEAFYERAMASVPLGTALRDARAVCRADAAAATSPSWLSFVLYGDPSITFRPSAARRASGPRRLAAVGADMRPLRKDDDGPILPRRDGAPPRSRPIWTVCALIVAALLAAMVWYVARRPNDLVAGPAAHPGRPDATPPVPTETARVVASSRPKPIPPTTVPPSSSTSTTATTSITVPLRMSPASRAPTAASELLAALPTGVPTWRDRAARMEFLITPRSGAPRTRIADVFDARLEDGTTKSLMFFRQPPEVEGTAFLAFHRPERSSDQWLYLPELQRVRQITANTRNQSYVGTDFTYGDIDFLIALQAGESVAKLVRQLGTSSLDDTPVSVWELRDFEVGYERVVVWFGLDDGIIRRVEMLDPGDHLAKTFIQGDIRTVDGIPVAHHGEMWTEASGSHTIVELFDVRLDRGLSDELFTPRALESGGP